MELEKENEKGSEKKYIVRLMCQDELKFVQFSDSELNLKDFPEKVANIFGIKFNDVPYSGLILTDNLGYPIPTHMFPEIVKTYHNGSMFYINVQYQTSSSLQGNLPLVTEATLASFFRRQNKADLLKHSKVQVLDDKSRILIVNCIVDFMIEVFGKGDPSKIQKHHKIMTARTAIVLFTGLKSSDPQNDLSKLLSSNGFFSARLKYLKTKYNEVNNQNSVEVTSQLSDMRLSTPEDNFQFLKTCVVKNTARSEIIRKLISTQTLRHETMQDPNVDLRTAFPFFFADPILIKWDFDNNPKFACNTESFISNWSMYSSKIRDLVDKNIQTEWNKDIEDLLLLLHVFPSKATRLTFINSMNKLIVFRVSGTPPANMIEKENASPYIVAYGMSKNDITSYYIVAEQHLISLPSEYDIVTTFDIFFKLHFVLDLQFDDALENMIVFIKRLIYNLRKGKASTSHMQCFMDKLH